MEFKRFPFLVMALFLIGYYTREGVCAQAWPPVLAAGLASVSMGAGRLGRVLICASSLLAGMTAGYIPGLDGDCAESAGVFRGVVETGTTRGVMVDLGNPGCLWASGRDIAGSCSRGDSLVVMGTSDGTFLNVMDFKVIRSGAAHDVLRRNISGFITQRTESRHTASLLTALLTGERGGIPGTVRSVFRDTGTSHLLALSGLHVGIVAAGVLLLLRRFLGNGWITVMAAAAVCGAYVLISGARPSTVRAWLMLIAVAVLWQLWGRVPQMLIVWTVALLLMSIMSGGSVLEDAGARMSFAAVLSLLFFGREFRGRLRWVRGALYAGIVVTFSLAPLVSGVYGGFNPVSPVATVISIPIMMALMITGSLAAVFPMIPGLPELAEWTAYVWLRALGCMGTGNVEYRSWMVAVWLLGFLVLWLFARRRGYRFRFA